MQNKDYNDYQQRAAPYCVRNRSNGKNKPDPGLVDGNFLRLLTYYYGNYLYKSCVEMIVALYYTLILVLSGSCLSSDFPDNQYLICRLVDTWFSGSIIIVSYTVS